MNPHPFRILWFSSAVGLVSRARDLAPPEKHLKEPGKEYPPCAEDHFLQNVYSGDTHRHLSGPTDSGLAGATLGPEAACRVSRGEAVTSHTGWKVKMIRPLDFVVAADHAEAPGLYDFLGRSDPSCWPMKLAKRGRISSRRARATKPAPNGSALFALRTAPAPR